MCLDGIENQIKIKKEELEVLSRKEKKQKKQMIEAHKEVTKYEKLREKRLKEYRECENKAYETYIEEFIKNEKNTRDFSHEMNFQTIVSI